MGKKIAFTSIIFLCVSLAQISLLSNISIIKSVPDILLLCLVYVSVNNGRLFGCVSGFISGLILDFLTFSPFGLHCLLRTIMGYVFGTFNKSVNISGFFFPFIMGLLASVLKGAVLILISLLYPNINVVHNVFSYVFLIEIVSNTILLPFVFKLMKLFDSSILLSLNNVY